jgi:hypothetical protein
VKQSETSDLEPRYFTPHAKAGFQIGLSADAARPFGMTNFVYCRIMSNIFFVFFAVSAVDLTTAAAAIIKTPKITAEKLDVTVKNPSELPSAASENVVKTIPTILTIHPNMFRIETSTSPVSFVGGFLF